MTTSSDPAEILLGSRTRITDIRSQDIHWSKEALDFFGSDVPDFDKACQLLKIIGCRLEKEVQSEEFLFGTEEETETVRLWRPANTTLAEMRSTHDSKNRLESEKHAHRWTVSHPQRDVEGTHCAVRLAELKTIPTLSPELAQLNVDVGTLYVVQEPLGQWQEVVCSKRVKWGVSSSAAFRKIDALDRRVLQTLRLKPYDGDRPGSNLQGVLLLRPIDTANTIAERYGWNLRFKPAEVTGNFSSPP